MILRIITVYSLSTKRIGNMTRYFVTPEVLCSLAGGADKARQ